MQNSLISRISHAPRQTTLRAAATGGILLLALVLRFYRLDGQSLWYDEGTSVALAGRDLLTITRNAAADIHPPLYYYLLHYWVLVFGTGEVAVRSLSALLGAGVVGLIARLGERLFGRAVGLAAALLAAVSPFLVYYSQETRMYMLATLLGLLSFILMLDLLGPASARRRAAYVLVTAAAIYTHYFAFAVVLAQNVLAGLWLAARVGAPAGLTSAEKNTGPAGRRAGSAWQALRDSWPGGWIACQVAVGLLYLPWLALTWDQLQRWPAVSQPFGPGFLAGEVLRIFPLGLSVPRQMTWWVAVLAGVLVAGLVPWPPPARPPEEVREADASAPPAGPGGEEWGPRWAIGAALLYLVVPVVTLYALSLRRPMYNPKFLLLAVPAYEVLLARGVLAPVVWLQRRTAARRNRPGERREGAPRLAPDLPSGRKDQPVVPYAGPPEGRTGAGAEAPPLRPPVQPPRFDAPGGSNSGQSPGLFARKAGGESGARLRWAAGVGMTLMLGAVVAGASLSSLANYFGDPRYARDDYRGIARYVESVGRPGDAVVLDAPAQAEVFSLYYHAGLPVVPLPRQRPANRQQTRDALADLAERYRRVFAVLWATNESDPEGIVEGWLNEHGYKALDVWYGNVRLAMWALPPAESAETRRPLSVELGDGIALAGYSLAATEVAAGDVLPVTLYWQARGSPANRYKVFVHLLDSRGQIIAQRDSEPAGGARPTTSWVPGATVADRLGLFVPFGTPPGAAQIVAGLYDAQTGQRLVVPGGPPDGRVPVAPVSLLRPPAPPPLGALGMQHAADVRFGALQLLGYSRFKLGAEHDAAAALRRGDTLHVVLYWRAGQVPLPDSTVTLRLLDENGRVAAQKSGALLDGIYPPAEWQAGEVVRDNQLLPVPADLAAGRYRLQLDVGLANGGRLRDPVELDTPAID